MSDFAARRCPNGHLVYPGGTRCPHCGERQVETVDLRDREGTVVTWTESVATPQGVRSPNTLAIVAFEVESDTVRVLGQTTDDVSVGDAVRPVYEEELRDPESSFRETASQAWDGYRFEPV
ncbi:MAG: Zn-ribbon domain-containing OB-fold protein [Haloarculaceae archaeon]